MSPSTGDGAFEELRLVGTTQGSCSKKKPASLMDSSPCRDDPPKIEKWSQNRSRKKMGIMLGAPREIG